ncbi:hypothetical protein Taro_050580 [Colocasia esculenta]|uniref:Uncharacterized protein n=1 Tax=Colocasia esculenta TaxID=4460 RepID=A0A843XEL3_COLES|nr:hypothetical protein [Colocasia esculenta]
MVAPACVASRPCGMSTVWGGSACGPSTSWRPEVAMLEVRRFLSRLFHARFCRCHATSECECAVGLAGAFWRVFPERCLGGSGGGSPRTCLHCSCSSTCCSVLSVSLCCLVVGLCILVKVLPKIALYRFWWRFFPGVLCVCFWPPLCWTCGSKYAVWFGCVLARFSQDGSWRFWWRFSPKLLCVVLVVTALFLCGDELSLLPIGLSVCRALLPLWVPDSVGFYGSRFYVFGVSAALAGEGLVIPTGPCSRGSPPLLPSARGSSSRELGVEQVAEAVVAPCVVSSSES